MGHFFKNIDAHDAEEIFADLNEILNKMLSYKIDVMINQDISEEHRQATMDFYDEQIVKIKTVMAKIK